MTEKKQQHKKKRGKVQHIRGSPKKRKISGKAFFSSESIPGKILADVKNQITDKASELKRADQRTPRSTGRVLSMVLPDGE